MSDGSVHMAMAWGYSHFELCRPMLVKPGWLKELREERQRRFGRLTNAEVAARLGERVKQEYHSYDTYAERAWYWNEHIASVCGYQLGFSESVPKRAKERRKAGYTEVLTPAEWLKVRGELDKIQVPQEFWTNAIWQDRVEKLMEFLDGRALPEGVYMDRNRPKLNTAKAANLVWYLQHLGIISNDEIDICDDCGRAIDTASETHDWCPTCGKMRCDSCTTRPYRCTGDCGHACAKHCTCPKEED